MSQKNTFFYINYKKVHLPICSPISYRVPGNFLMRSCSRYFLLSCPPKKYIYVYIYIYMKLSKYLPNHQRNVQSIYILTYFGNFSSISGFSGLIMWTMFLNNRATGQMCTVFVNGPGFNPGRVIPKTQKWYSKLPWLILSVIRYISRVKWSHSGDRVAPFYIRRCCSYWKGSLRVTLDCDLQLFMCLNKLILQYTAFIWMLTYLGYV